MAYAKQTLLTEATTSWQTGSQRYVDAEGLGVGEMFLTTTSPCSLLGSSMGSFRSLHGWASPQPFFPAVSVPVSTLPRPSHILRRRLLPRGVPGLFPHTWKA